MSVITLLYHVFDRKYNIKLSERMKSRVKQSQNKGRYVCMRVSIIMYIFNYEVGQYEYLHLSSRLEGPRISAVSGNHWFWLCVAFPLEAYCSERRTTTHMKVVIHQYHLIKYTSQINIHYHFILSLTSSLLHSLDTQYKMTKLNVLSWCNGLN